MPYNKIANKIAKDKYMATLSSEVKNERWRKYDLKRFFNIAIEEYNRLFSLQAGRCAICKKHQNEFKRRLAVDHNHITGKIRSLLCVLCNTNLAVLEDKEFCMKASIYLQEKI